jgi:hypothetical protein
MIPSTWREGGAGIYGRLGDRVSYQAYGVVSMDGDGFGAGGYRGGRQKGIGEWGLANNFSFTGRVDVDVFSGLMVGGSFYTGHQGQDQEAVGGTPVGDLQMTMYEIHAQYQRYGFHFRALFSQAYIDNPNTWNAVNATGAGDAQLASESQGWYIEGAYNVFSLLMPDSKQSLEPFLRYSQVNTQKAFQTAPTAQQLAAGQKFNVDVLTVGIQYKPIPQIVFKLDYLYEWGNESNIDYEKQIQVGVGYVF